MFLFILFQVFSTNPLGVTSAIVQLVSTEGIKLKLIIDTVVYQLQIIIIIMSVSLSFFLFFFSLSVCLSVSLSLSLSLSGTCILFKRQNAHP